MQKELRKLARDRQLTILSRPSEDEDFSDVTLFDVAPAGNVEPGDVGPVNVVPVNVVPVNVGPGNVPPVNIAPINN